MGTKQKWPNLFIIGAPRSGTTSLAHYLSGHPRIFFSDPKELFYWADDYPRLRQFYFAERQEDYLRHFRRAAEQHLFLAEGSTNYLASFTAVPNILKSSPDARFIAMIRNPVEMVPSWHQFLLRAFYEDEHDIEAAWNLQESRKAGDRIPATCLAPQYLQYQTIASYGHQLDRLFQIVPAENRHVILFDDFVENPAREYAETLAFLGLENDNPSCFPVINASSQIRFARLHHFLRRPPKSLERIIYPFRNFFTGHELGLRGKIKSIFKKRIKNSLKSDFAAQLRDVFRDDIGYVSELLKRDLTHWAKNLAMVK